jgi:hypothetical protein
MVQKKFRAKSLKLKFFFFQGTFSGDILRVHYLTSLLLPGSTTEEFFIHTGCTLSPPHQIHFDVPSSLLINVSSVVFHETFVMSSWLISADQEILKEYHRYHIKYI